MHKLIDYICDELETIEKKAEKGNLSLSEIDYADKLAHLKKNLLRSEELEDEGYSGDNMRYYSGARGRMSPRRDSRGRYASEPYYSMDNHELVSELRNLMNESPNEQTKTEFKHFIQRIENM